MRFILLFLFCCNWGFAQELSVSGTVTDKASAKPMGFASVSISGTPIGTTSDENGKYILNIPHTLEGKFLIASFTGYKPDSIKIQADRSNYKFSLLPIEINIREVVVSGTMKEMSRLESPIPVEVYSPAFFTKNPSPGIFESLNMVNGVQPQLNCNVCNTGDIHINGMEGPYTMVLIDGMPIISSLSTVYGMSGIPNSMIKRVEIVKGPASTLYGSEAVGGLINIITVDPGSAPLFKADVSVTSFEEINADISTKFKTGKAFGLLGLNGFYFDRIHDVNNDNFTDVTLQKRISIFNKWDFNRASGLPSSLALRYIYENRWGGETTYTEEFRGTDSIYGESIYTNRFELIGNQGLNARNNIRLQYSYNYHHQDSYYGITKYYADQHTAFIQLLADRTLGKHNLLAGLPFRFTSYDDNSPATAREDLSNKPQLTWLPGIFIQDEIKFNKKFTALAGIRYDYNNEHGNIFTPRLSFKYSLNDFNTIRLSGGNGYRVVNLFTEDHAALTGARTVVIRNELKPEQSWNVNINYLSQKYFNKGFISYDFSAFYTYFSNRIVGDFMSDPDLIVYDNLTGYSVSQGITVNTELNLDNGIKLMAGATLMDVFIAEDDSLGNEIKSPQLFAPEISGTWSAGYEFRKRQITIDLTGRLNGPMYLPVVPDDFRPDTSPWYAIVNFQVTKKWKKGTEFYAGVKNILDFIPDNPILRPFDPFDKNVDENNPHHYTFDPSYNYAPVQGIKMFAGFRYTIQGSN